MDSWEAQIELIRSYLHDPEPLEALAMLGNRVRYGESAAKKLTRVEQWLQEASPDIRHMIGRLVIHEMRLEAALGYRRYEQDDNEG